MRDARQPEGVAPPRSPYSPVVRSGDLVFTAGQVALRRERRARPGRDRRADRPGAREPRGLPRRGRAARSTTSRR